MIDITDGREILRWFLRRFGAHHRVVGNVLNIRNSKMKI